MAKIKAGKFIYQNKFNSEVTISDFKYVIEDLSTELKDKGLFRFRLILIIIQYIINK